MSPDSSVPDTTNSSGTLSTTFISTLAWGISGVWLSSFIVDIFVKEYDPPATVHGLMMLVAGAAFGKKIWSKDE